VIASSRHARTQELIARRSCGRRRRTAAAPPLTTPRRLRVEPAQRQIARRRARDREHATRCRPQADRDALLNQLAIAETAGLTGTRARATGLEHIDQEIERARRTTAPLVVAYVDVVGLKAVNASQGHAADDALLQRAVDGIRGHLRSYDLIVRIGGDEVCA
jgi:GGDEF domain-containing protein